MKIVVSCTSRHNNFFPPFPFCSDHVSVINKCLRKRARWLLPRDLNSVSTYLVCVIYDQREICTVGKLSKEQLNKSKQRNRVWPIQVNAIQGKVIQSTGRVLYEVLKGKAPPRGLTSITLFYTIFTETVVLPSRIPLIKKHTPQHIFTTGPCNE